MKNGWWMNYKTTDISEVYEIVGSALCYCFQTANSVHTIWSSFLPGAHPASYPMGTRGILLWKQSGSGVKLTTHLHLVSRSKNAWSYTSTPQYAFMAWCLVKHRDNFAFTVLDFWVPYKAGNFLTTWAIISFSGRTLLHGFSKQTRTLQCKVEYNTFILCLCVPSTKTDWSKFEQEERTSGANYRHPREADTEQYWKCWGKYRRVLFSLPGNFCQ
jgi:hypothetical protein